MCGGHSQPRACDEEETAMFVGLKAGVEAIGGEAYAAFEPVHCTSQVVNGTIFWIKFSTDKGFVHAKVYRPLPHTGQPAQVQIVHTGQTADATFNTQAQ